MIGQRRCSPLDPNASTFGGSGERVTSDRDRLEPRPDAERPQQVADVVSDGLGGQVKISRDLLRRRTSLEEAQNLGLTRRQVRRRRLRRDRKSTRLNSSHTVISYAVFCLKKKKKKYRIHFLYKKKKNK